MYDLHTHSICSDGSDSPQKVAELAWEKGLDLLALTDHDCTDGVEAAMKRADELGLSMLAGAEMEASYRATLHLLTLGIDYRSNAFRHLVVAQDAFRLERNEKMERKLRKIGCNVSDFIDRRSKSITRFHYAAALVKAGYAESIDEAFKKYVGEGGTAYVKQERFSPEKVIRAANDAGGIVVIAHPMKMKCDPCELISEMKQKGVWGVEAYYSTATEGEIALFSSLARSNSLFVTCGSDYHGASRPKCEIGISYRDVRELASAREELNKVFGV